MGGAVSMEPGAGGGRRRALDAMINVVPAIDLLSCCIVFLLVTAVWTQIARLQASQYGSAAASPAQPGAVAVTLRLGAQGHVLQLSTGADVAVPASGRGPDGEPRYDYAALAARLAELKGRYPDQAAITVAAEDGVRYADLVHTIDACVGAGLAGVSVTGSAG
jgi:biopolymer transport protein ExbD